MHMLCYVIHSLLLLTQINNRLQLVLYGFTFERHKKVKNVSCKVYCVPMIEWIQYTVSYISALLNSSEMYQKLVSEKRQRSPDSLLSLHPPVARDWDLQWQNCIFIINHAQTNTRQHFQMSDIVFVTRLVQLTINILTK